MYVVKNVTIFDGEQLQENKNVLISRGKIIDVIDSFHPVAHQVRDEIQGNGNILAPGFIDIQVNGGGGFFFNETPEVDALKNIAQTHLQLGTTSFLPTFITDSFSQMKKAMQAVQTCLSQNVPGILGIHLEGPFLNLEKKGIHHPSFIRSPSKQEIKEICEFNLPLKIMTCAPEIMSKQFMETLHKKNVILFAGHTMATFEEMQQAVEQGVKGITHFFNACSPFTSRQAGVVGYGLWDDSLYCGLIADGIHVSFPSLRVALKNAPNEKYILVSDAMAPVGTELKEFSIHGQKIKVTENKYMDENGVLSGSSLTLLQALKNIVFQHCAPLKKALAMTSTNAAKCLQLDHIKGKICPNYDADCVLLDKETLNLLKVIQGGVIK